ncbi:MAG: carotenoid biosynthesis protein [Nitrosopumilaceae archaeon]
MKNKILLYVSISFLALFIYSTIVHPFLEDYDIVPEFPGGVSSKTIFMLFFSLFHALYYLGWRKTLVFFVITAAVSWGYEEIGVETGIVYGKYHYTDYLGQKIGHVPLIIPLAWFMMIYPSYVIANIIYSKNAFLKKITFSKIIMISLLSAAVMTAWDTVIDPYLSGPTVGAWVWENGGVYFGVPIHNFVGWIVTTFTIYVLYRIFEAKSKTIEYSKNNYLILPVIAYGLMLAANLIPGEPAELIYIGPVIMGIPFVLAIIRYRAGKKLSILNNS